MTAEQLKETLSIIAAKAKDLRDAGVTRVVVGDVQIELAAQEPPPTPFVTLPSGPANETHPLDDAETFGGDMPRRRGAPQATEDEQE